MCLTVDNKIHLPDSNGDRSAFTATFPILVYKVLDICPNGPRKYASSPYRGSRWVFGKQQTSQLDRRDEFGFILVNIGLHAFTKSTTIHARRLRMYNSAEMFPAIIPVGSTFWIGAADEIVSDTMTVYESITDVLKAYNVPNIGNPVKKTSLTKNG